MISIGGSIFVFLLQLIMEETLLATMKNIQEFVLSKWPQLLKWIEAYPLQFAVLFLVTYVFILLTITYLQTLPPRGIKVSYEEKDDDIILFLTNNTKNDLSNAYLKVNWMKPEPKPALMDDGTINPVKLLFGASPPTPLNGTLLMWEIEGDYRHRTIIESKRSAKSHILKIESTGEIGFWINNTIGRPLINRSATSSKRSLIYLDEGRVKAEIQFGGTKPDGEVLVKEFELIFDYDGNNVKVKRIWQ